MTARPVRAPQPALLALFLSLALTWGSGASAAGPAAKDAVTADDLIVQGSLCIGLECIDNESFGFDTVRIKQPSVRLGFVDTSVNVGYPTTDWQITINDADGAGSEEYFAIDNVDTGARIVKLFGAAPANSLVVNDLGFLGLGTAIPMRNVHMYGSNTPTIRLEQGTGGGNAAMTWDVAGNEANFFVRDQTNGSRLPLRIFPGAPTNSLVVAASGFIGTGLSAPTAPLHVFRDDGSAMLRVEESHGTPAPRTLMELINNGPAALRLTDSASASSWDLAGDSSLTFATVAAVTPQFTMAANGDIAITGTLSQGSSRLLKTAIEAVDPSDLFARALQLPVYQWSYIGRPASERHIGPMAEDFHALFGLGGDAARLAPSDVAGVALVAVQELATQVEQRKRDIAEIRARIDALEATAK